MCILGNNLKRKNSDLDINMLCNGCIDSLIDLLKSNRYSPWILIRRFVTIKEAHVFFSVFFSFGNFSRGLHHLFFTAEENTASFRVRC